MIELIRYGSTPQGTFGELYVDDEFFAYTVEQPWNNNEPFASCIPAGMYELVPHNSSKYGHTLVFVNHSLGVYHWEGPGVKRFACLIHTANYATDVQGCVGLGESLSGHGGKWMVTNSAVTVDQFFEQVSPKENHDISIKWREYD